MATLIATSCATVCATGTCWTREPGGPPGAPHYVTVRARSCTEAGALATLAVLRGTDAELFLKEKGSEYWCGR